MTQYPVLATNAILVGDVPLFMEWEAAVSSVILAGDVVQFNAPPGDCTIKEAVVDSTEAIGIANIHPVPGATPPRGGDRVTAFAAGDQVEVMRGDLTVMLRVAHTNAIQCGEMVQPAAGGEVMAFICGTDNDCQRIAQSLYTIASDTTTFQWGLFALERFG